MTTRSKKASFSERHPIWTVTILELLLIVTLFAAGAYVTIQEIDIFSPVAIAFIPVTIALLIYLSVRGKWSALGFSSLSNIAAKNWIFYLPLLAILITLCLKGFKENSGSDILLYVGFTLMVGFVEETLYRGLILQTLLRKSVGAAVITSSILFAVTHVLNILSGQNTFDTILQIVYALLVGLALALLIIKNHNIFPLIIFHFLHNLIQFLGNESKIGYDLTVIFILIVQCVWVVADLKKKPVQPPVQTGL
ncbi:CAAX protease family protein [Paenibacillus selenitireducens]|uniref:CAAX protease family protein n=1 Tax=Paenibacillus selenitireducens TaxID=1324314 RepID=A0A1T2XAD6_9BACL|nr:CPBP family intramembrane glutamic endopeptidase [Paenibacillus selenitireducens]OPA76857.1 CAAX protease family protein [Paenibacillus selenitireducens]